MTTATAAKIETGRRPARVLIVDDHPIVREGYEQLIGNQKDMEVCAVASESAEALRMIEKSRPDLAIIDLSLKNGNGLELCKKIKGRFPEVKILVASMHDEALFAERALRAGARGYISKDQTVAKLADAIRAVLMGTIWLSSAMNDRMLSRAVGKEGPGDDSPVASLSDRELEVYELIGQGLPVRQIAERLNLSTKTVESYRENIKTKLNLQNGSELTRSAVQWILENN